MEIKMSRFENAPWGFRVHGGIDFGSPLTIQKVRKRPESNKGRLTFN